ncbi:MAG: FecR domain-containing protein, partial [Spirochaetota bacterium]
MNLSSKDVIITLISFSVIAASSAGLYLDYTSRIRASQTEQIGTITFKKKTAERKYGDQMIWEDVGQQTPVYNYDSLRTAEGASAVVRLKDGTNIDLDENTLIMLSVSAKGADIDLSGGSIFAKTGEAGKGKAVMNIRSGGAAVEVADGALNMTKTSGKTVDLSVTSGAAVLSGGASAPVSIGPNQTAVVSDGKADLKANSLVLQSPSPNSYFVRTPSAAQSVLFEWKGAGDDYTLSVSTDRGFKNTVLSKKGGSG